MRILKKNTKLFFFLEDTDLKTRILLFLGFIAFITFAVDIGSELAAEKNEITYIVATINGSLTSVNLHLQYSINPDLPFRGNIPPANSSFINDDFKSLPPERGPPSEPVS